MYDYDIVFKLHRYSVASGDYRPSGFHPRALEERSAEVNSRAPLHSRKNNSQKQSA